MPSGAISITASNTTDQYAQGDGVTFSSGYAVGVVLVYLRNRAKYELGFLRNLLVAMRDRRFLLHSEGENLALIWRPSWPPLQRMAGPDDKPHCIAGDIKVRNGDEKLIKARCSGEDLEQPARMKQTTVVRGV